MATPQRPKRPVTRHAWGLASVTDRSTGRRLWGWTCSCGTYYTRYRTRHAAESHARRHVAGALAPERPTLIIEGIPPNA